LKSKRGFKEIELREINQFPFFRQEVVSQGLEGLAGDFLVFPMFRKGIPEGY